MALVIFTDLDGTLLDHDSYSYEAALPTLELVRSRRIPLIVCTSKTRAEIEQFRNETANTHPYIVENGGAICIPKSYFKFEIPGAKEQEGFLEIVLGTEYSLLLGALAAIRQAGIPAVGFSDMSDEQVADDTGLSVDAARLARRREYDEAFRMDDLQKEPLLKEIIKSRGLFWTRGGRYWHIMGSNDKGRAVGILASLFRKQGEITTVGLGDSPNDFPMLDNVDIAYLVQRPDGSYASDHYRHALGIGPVGWKNAVLEVVR